MTLVQKEVKAVYLWTTKVRPPYKPRTFTITRTEQSNMSSWWTYSDDAAWLTAGDTAFDEFFWYYGCRLNTSGVETDTITQADSGWAWKLDITQLWTLTSGDNVMIAFPVRWIKMSKSWSTVTLSITEELDKDGYQYYAHSTGTLSNPWTPKDVFYLGAYEWYVNSTTLKSWSGKTPTVSQRQSVFCTYAKNNWTWYNIEWYYQRMYVNALYIMKYWNPDSQSVVWKWYVWSNYSTTTWWANSQTNATYWTSSTSTQIKLFGLEDWWGNIYEFVWWAYTDGSKYLYTQLSWYSGASGWWESTWSTIQHSWNWYELSSIVWNNKVMFWPSSTVNNSSYNTYYCDNTWVYASCIASAGGNSSSSGAFMFMATNAASGYSSNGWARLMYL